MPIWIYLFSLLFSYASCATTVDMKTQTNDQKTTYLLKVGNYSDQSEAQKVSQELKKKFKQNATVIFSKQNKNYHIELGPLQTLSKTQKLKENIEQYIKEPTEIPNNSGVMWNLRNANIRAVIDEVSRVTGKNFIIDPRVQGKISIVSSTPMNNKELYQVFLSILRVSGYAAVPNGHVIKIIPNIEAKTQSSNLLNQLKNPSAAL